MENGNGFEASAAYRLDPGTEVDSPILLPLPGGDCDLFSMMQVCRHVCPGGPLLIADFLHLLAPGRGGGTPPLPLIADRLAAIISDAAQAHDLSLIPLIVIGNAEEPTLQCALGLRMARSWLHASSFDQ